MWLKKKIKDHCAATGNSRCTIYRDYDSKTVVIDWYGGPCTLYTYDGEWIAG